VDGAVASSEKLRHGRPPKRQSNTSLV
jgi:hypothetical protein